MCFSQEIEAFFYRIGNKKFRIIKLSLWREYKCGKWFIDFADLGNKIALEIDDIILV